MTKLTNEELLAGYVGKVASNVQVDSDSMEDEIDGLRAEILKRMAEGAAGEASPLPTPVHMPPRGVTTGIHTKKEDVTQCLLPNGDGLESAGRVVASEPLQPVVTRSGEASPLTIVPEQGQIWYSLRIQGKHIWRFTKDELESGLGKRVGEINDELAESGSASTAGPRPRCPKCGYADGLPLYPPTEIQPNIEVACPHCGFSVMSKVDERGYVDLEAFAQFFAAAPAEDASVCFRCEGTKTIQNEDGTKDVMCESCEGTGKTPAPEDVQLDVEAVAKEIRRKEMTWEYSSPRFDEMYSAAEVEKGLALALLRRVSGKGAQGPGAKVQVCGYPLGSSGYIALYCSRELGHSGDHQCFTTPVPVPSPAPVPATPERECITQKDWLECIDLADIHNTIGSSGYQPDDMIRRLEQIHNLLLLVKPLATTQGTPEGL